MASCVMCVCVLDLDEFAVRQPFVCSASRYHLTLAAERICAPGLFGRCMVQLRETVVGSSP